MGVTQRIVELFEAVDKLTTVDKTSTLTRFVPRQKRFVSIHKRKRQPNGTKMFFVPPKNVPKTISGVFGTIITLNSTPYKVCYRGVTKGVVELFEAVDNLAVVEHPFISQKVFIKSFGKSQFLHKSVNLFFTLAIIKDKLTNLNKNWRFH